MGSEDIQANEMARLEAAYLQSLADANAMDISDVARIAMILEIEAKYLGALESCRTGPGATRKTAGARRN